MYKEHNNYRLPENENEVIWRYMDLWKFEDLLQKKSLYFSTIKNMGDKFEGRIPASIADIWIKKFENEKNHSMIKTIECLKSYEHVLNYNILCWNMSQSESFALWKIYTKNSKAIAIKSNIKSLKESLEINEFWQYIGLVNYYSNPLNFNFDSNIMNLAINKFNYYNFENELRIVNFIPGKLKSNFPENIEGGDILVPVDLNCLIESIYLAPNASETEYNYISQLLKENNLSKNIMISGINDNWANL